MQGLRSAVAVATLVIMKRLLLLQFVMVFATVCWSTLASAEPRRIILNDGTEIIGELLSLQNGAYKIRSETLGTLTVSERQVAKIASLGASATPDPVKRAESSLAGDSVQRIQQSLMGNVEMMQLIMRLQSNPDMQAVLSDPETMAAIQRMDFDSLLKNPKIIKLMQNNEIKVITEGAN